MQPLIRTLQDHDLGHLRILAELWDVDLPPGSTRQAVEALTQTMLDPTAVIESAESLPLPIRQALDFILCRDGRVPMADLIRRFGALREMGPGRRDRERPWRSPVSPIEALWYRGLIARAFADTPSGPQEFGFIPTDLLNLLPKPSSTSRELPGQQADPPPRSQPATSVAIDDATTLLAALRRQPCAETDISPARREYLFPFLHQPSSLDLLLMLLHTEAILVAPHFRPDPQTVRAFLDAPRSEALRSLLLAWKRSTTWNDLQHVPHLTCASETWPNDPLASRHGALEFLNQVPQQSWWDMDSYVETVRERQPGYQRPAGNFDSWYLCDDLSGKFLRGFKHWDTVDGALVRFIITGPLHWLGAADLGMSDQGHQVTCFRLTPAVAVLFDPQAPLTIKESTASTTIRPDGQITVPRRAVRALRYQIARFSAWDPINEESYHYRLIPTTLNAAVDQGLGLNHIITILETSGDGPIPATLRAALERWSKHGSEARLEEQLVLRLRQPEVLRELQENRSTARYLGEVLGPTAVIIRKREWIHLHSSAARLGILIDPPPPYHIDPP